MATRATATSDSVSEETLLERARALKPVLAERAGAAEKLRKLPEETH